MNYANETLTPAPPPTTNGTRDAKGNAKRERERGRERERERGRERERKNLTALKSLLNNEIRLRKYFLQPLVWQNQQMD